jgi:hypothetical protein
VTAGRSEQLHIFERRLFVLLEIEAKPASGEAAESLWLLPSDQRRQFERLGDRYASDLARGHFCEDEVVALQRSPEDGSRMALGRQLRLSGPVGDVESN